MTFFGKCYFFIYLRKAQIDFTIVYSHCCCASSPYASQFSLYTENEQAEHHSNTCDLSGCQCGGFCV